MKEFGIVDGANLALQQFVIGLKGNSLTELETKCKIDSLGLEFENMIYHHSRTLKSIVYYYKDNRSARFRKLDRARDPKKVPLGFRSLKLEDFPKLRLLTYDGGKYLVDRSGQKAKMVYLSY